MVLSDASTSATAFKPRLEQDGFGLSARAWMKPQWNSSTNNLTTPAILKEISYPYQVFGRLQYHGPCVKSWRPYLGQSALRSEGFSSIRLDAHIGKWFGTKM